jgi:hypothetical protein
MGRSHFFVVWQNLGLNRVSLVFDLFLLFCYYCKFFAQEDGCEGRGIKSQVLSKFSLKTTQEEVFKSKFSVFEREGG